MSDRIELRYHDFLAEGRDVSKSHVLFEIAQPSANEVATHGHFFAIAELAGATPKTIQMVRAWVEFAIESYYKSVPTSVENHFETILGQLNTQSSLYLKQHANEEINIAVAVVCNSMLYLAVHGKPAALLFYRKDEAWQSMNMVDPNSIDQPGQLFSNVVTGAMRVEDQFLLATPHVTEFFSADRLSKISETKSMREVNDHMLRVLSELSSEYSFAGVWLRLVRAFDETKEIMQTKIANAPEPEKKSNSSMSELLSKTRDTASILAPPVLMIPKDKIITNILKLAQTSVISGGKAIITTTTSSVAFIKKNKNMFGVEKISDALSGHKLLDATKINFVSKFSDLPKKRKTSMALAIGVAVIAIIAVGAIAFNRSSRAQNEASLALLEQVREKIFSANESFTYQNESVARTQISEAAQIFSQLPSKLQASEDGVAVSLDITEKRDRILHVKKVTPAPFDEASATPAKDMLSVGVQIATLSEQGEIALFGSTSKKLGAISGAQSIYFDESNKRIVAAKSGRAFSSISLDGKKTSDISVSWMPEDTQTDSLTFYSGRLYSYNNKNQAIFRYDGVENSYGAGKRWIVDGSKPSNVVELSIDTSVWMKTADGKILKYTAGKAQTFKISGLEPEATNITQIVTSNSTNVYFLDSENNRIIQTTRDGKLITQFVYPSDTKLQKIALDKNEIIATGLLADGRIVKIGIGK